MSSTKKNKNTPRGSRSTTASSGSAATQRTAVPNSNSNDVHRQSPGLRQSPRLREKYGALQQYSQELLTPPVPDGGAAQTNANAYINQSWPAANLDRAMGSGRPPLFPSTHRHLPPPLPAISINMHSQPMESQLTVATAIRNTNTTTNYDDEVLFPRHNDEYEVEEEEEEEEDDNDDEAVRGTHRKTTARDVDDDDDDSSTKLSNEDASSINDYSADVYDVNERTYHFMGKIPISPSNRSAVEAVYMLEAYTLVKDQKQMRRMQVAERVRSKYRELIDNIPNSRFSENALKAQMVTKLYRARNNSSAEAFLDKVEDVAGHVRGIAGKFKGAGKPIHTLRSGCSLSDAKKEHIAHEYKVWLLKEKKGDDSNGAGSAVSVIVSCLLTYRSITSALIKCIHVFVLMTREAQHTSVFRTDGGSQLHHACIYLHAWCTRATQMSSLILHKLEPAVLVKKCEVLTNFTSKFIP